MTKDLVKSCLYSTVLRKGELVSDEIRYLAEVISKQNVRGVTWLLLSAYNKM